MELKDVKFETVGEAAKAYPQSTLVIRKQFFDGVVARFQDTIKTRTEMFIDEQKIRIGLAENLQKEYHKTFELQEQIRKQKYWRCMLRAKEAERIAQKYKNKFYEPCPKQFESLYLHLINLYSKWAVLWKRLSEKYKQPIEPIEKDLETL